MTRDSKLTTNKNISWYVITRTILGDYCGGAPPLPIPNREVKPASADGTAFICGRVGRRQSLPKAPVLFEPGPFLLSRGNRILASPKIEKNLEIVKSRL